MDKTQPLQEPSQAEHPPSREEQAPTTAKSRKREIDSDSGVEPLTKRARLTQKNLALFDKMGKKKSSDPTEDSKTTKTTSTTTSGFADKAYKNHILHPHYSKRPTNIDDIRRRYGASRDTASPPESIYERYADRIEGAGNEATTVIESSKLLKEYNDKGYRRAFNRPFTNAPQDAGYNNGLSAPQPDFVEGLARGEFRPLPVDDHVPGAVLYRDDPLSVTLPHVAGEWKGPDGSMREAELQSAYDGAAMVYARRQALAFMGKSDPPGHAAITTFTTDGTNLNMYAHYAAPSEEDKDTLEYHQCKYASTNIRDSHQGHKDGRRGLRNSQDYAKDQSYALKDQLRKHWKQQRSTVHPIAEEEPLLVPDKALEEASADEEAPPYEEVADEDYEVVEPQPIYQPTPPTSSRPKHSQKQKVQISQESSSISSRYRSKLRSYWKKDRETS
ncbi:hypothetical protein Neosp_003483 [[Neocosmospora] mangrovei]